MRKESRLCEEVEKAKKYVYRLLAHRGRTRKEVRERLRQKGFPGRVIEQVIKRFVELNYLDDRAFAFNWADMKLSAKPCGRRLIESELRKKGVDDRVLKEVVEKVYAGKDEASMARSVAKARFKKAVSGDRRKERDRVYRLLLRRGFAPEVVNEVVEEAFRNEVC